MNLKEQISAALMASSMALAGAPAMADDMDYQSKNMDNKSATNMDNKSATNMDHKSTTNMDNPSTTNMDNPSTTNMDNPSTTNMDNPSTTNMDNSANTSAPVVLLVPMVYAANDTLADGCWARLYNDRNYAGNQLTLTGPIQISDHDPYEVTGYQIGRNYSSVAVGPNATLMVYDNDNFADKSATFQSGERVPALDSDMAYFEEIKSMKLTCSTDATAMAP